MVKAMVSLALPAREEYDIERTAFLESKNYRVLRFWNNQDMNEIQSVFQAIFDALVED